MLCRLKKCKRPVQHQFLSMREICATQFPTEAKVRSVCKSNSTFDLQAIIWYLIQPQFVIQYTVCPYWSIHLQSHINRFALDSTKGSLVRPMSLESNKWKIYGNIKCQRVDNMKIRMNDLEKRVYSGIEEQAKKFNETLQCLKVRVFQRQHRELIVHGISDNNSRIKAPTIDGSISFKVFTF